MLEMFFNFLKSSELKYVSMPKKDIRVLFLDITTLGSRLPIVKNKFPFEVFFSIPFKLTWFCTRCSDNQLTYTANIQPTAHVQYHLQVQRSLSNVGFYLVDIFGYKRNLTYTVAKQFLVYQWSSQNGVLSLRTILNCSYHKLILSTLSTLVVSSTWLEREVLECASVLFLGLLDSRRLLKDYTLSACTLSKSSELSWLSFNSSTGYLLA